MNDIAGKKERNSFLFSLKPKWKLFSIAKGHKHIEYNVMQTTIQYLSMDSKIVSMSSKMEPELSSENFLHKLHLVKLRKSCAASNFFGWQPHYATWKFSGEIEFFSSVHWWMDNVLALWRWMGELIVIHTNGTGVNESERRGKISSILIYF